jgi:hypothetical protein
VTADAQIAILGTVLAEAAGDDPGFGAALDALDAAHPEETDQQILARFVLDRLAAEGWQLTRTPS